MANRTGTDGPETIYGTIDADRIDGRGGSDLIYAKAGDDFIIGGRGNDTINGGWGSDKFYFGLQHSADTVQDFGRDLAGGNSDTIVLDQSIDGYFVFDESSGIRIVTVDNGVKQGSITLSHVTGAEWASWGGTSGTSASPAYFTTDMGPADHPLIDLGYILTA